MKLWYLYHIRFENLNEEFEKIGITKKSPQERFCKEYYKGYSLKILHLVRLPENECKLEEKRLLSLYKEISYKPLDETFSGKTECFEPWIINFGNLE